MGYFVTGPKPEPGAGNRLQPADFATANGRYPTAGGVVARARYVRTIAPAATIAIENAKVCGSVHAMP